MSDNNLALEGPGIPTIDITKNLDRIKISDRIKGKAGMTRVPIPDQNRLTIEDKNKLTQLLNDGDFEAAKQLINDRGIIEPVLGGWRYIPNIN